MHYAHHSLAAVFLLAFACNALSQPQLVFAAEKTKQYHRPSCPLIRDAKGVIAMTAGQAEARGFKSHSACDPAQASSSPVQPGPDRPTSTGRRPIFVYTAAGDGRYHRATCTKLPKEHRKVSLEEAGKKLWPCSVCRPPIRKRTLAVPNRYGRD